MDEIFRAIGFGIRVTIWIFRQTFSGYVNLYHWYTAKNMGEDYPFPLLSVGLSMGLTIFLLWFFIAGSG